MEFEAYKANPETVRRYDIYSHGAYEVRLANGETEARAIANFIDLGLATEWVLHAIHMREARQIQPAMEYIVTETMKGLAQQLINNK